MRYGGPVGADQEERVIEPMELGPGIVDGARARVDSACLTLFSVGYTCPIVFWAIRDARGDIAD